MRPSDGIKNPSTAARALSVFILFMPAVLYAMFFLGAAGSYGGIWTNGLLVCAGVLGIAALAGRRKWLFAGAYFVLGLYLASRVELGGPAWLLMTYVPYVFLGAFIFGMAGAVMFALAVPMFMARHLMLGVSLESIALIVGSSLAGGLGLLPAMKRPRRDRVFRRDKSPAPSVDSSDKDDYDISPPVNMDGLMGEEHEALRELLRIAVFATRAASVSLFTLSGEQLRIRCSSVASGAGSGEAVSPVPRWYVNDVLRLRHTIVTGNLGAETTQGFVNRSAPLDGLDASSCSGGSHREEALSIAASPVMEHGTVVGVLAVSSPGSNSFRGNTVTVLELISAQVARTLAGSRVHAETERDMDILRMVYEESSRLVSSIDLKEIISILADVMHNISGLDVRIYIRTPAGFALAHGGSPGKVDLSGTLAAMVLAEGDTRYITDLSGYSNPLLPGAAPGDFASAVIMPLICSGDIMGLVVLSSQRKDPLRPQDIHKLGMVVGQAGISLKNAMFHTQMKVQAVTDALTGLDNRRRLMENLEAEHRRFLRTGVSYAVVMMDIDHFKGVNDTHGHQAGDDVLRAVAERMRSVFRDTDFLGRYGGEEFAAVLVDTDMRGALGMAERMRLAVQDAPFDIGPQSIRLTLSQGVSLSVAEMEASDIVSMADEALYRAKEGGRNRVEFSR